MVLLQIIQIPKMIMGYTMDLVYRLLGLGNIMYQLMYCNIKASQRAWAVPATKKGHALGFRRVGSHSTRVDLALRNTSC